MQPCPALLLVTSMTMTCIVEVLAFANRIPADGRRRRRRSRRRGESTAAGPLSWLYSLSQQHLSRIANITRHKVPAGCHWALGLAHGAPAHVTFDCGGRSKATRRYHQHQKQGAKGKQQQHLSKILCTLVADSEQQAVANNAGTY